MSKKPILTRRDFVRGTVGSALAASLVGPSVLRAEEKVGDEDIAVAPPADAVDPGPDKSKVLVVRNADVMNDKKQVNPNILETMVAGAVMGVTGSKHARDAWASLFKPDDVVGLFKTGFMNATHDELITVVTAALVDIGVPAENIRVDGQNGESPETVKEYTAMICMPALKAHWLTGIGTVIKNYIMLSGKPSSYHGDDSAKLGEIWQLPDVEGKTKLVLVDALRPMCNKGPQPDPRYKWNYKGLIAGVDPVAVETVCWNLLNAKREAIKGEPWPLTPNAVCIEAADTTYGLGTSDPDRIDIQVVGWTDEALV